MIECPWCTKKVIIANDVCPECFHEVLLDQEGNVVFDDDVDVQNDNSVFHPHVDLDLLIAERFICTKCDHKKCNIKEVAMTGTGLSKIFDIQHNHFLFVSCDNCGYVEIYDPEVLLKNKAGKLGTIMDILFGG